MIYFIQEENNREGLIKIGYSVNPYGRLKQIQGMSPIRLEIIKLLEGDTNLEYFLHNEFSDLRVQGEWFSPGKKLQLFMIDPSFLVKEFYRIDSYKRTQRLEELHSIHYNNKETI